MKRVLVNAQPMMVVGTGIGRYLRGLARAVEQEFADDIQLSYFVGVGVVDSISENRDAGWLERVGQLLWRMPQPVAYGARLMRHVMTERRFSRSCTGFDVYHEAGYFPLKMREPVRTVLTVHDLSLLRYPEFHPAERVRYARRYFKDRLPFVDGFCAVSEFTKREIVEHLGIDSGQIRVTPLGYDAEVFNTSDDPDAQAILDRSGVPERFVLFVGSGDPRKNLQFAIAALERTTSGTPLVTVGWSGWEPDGRGGCLNLGYVSDRVLAQLYRRALILVMPSEYEGFGLPVLEAMACGCPVVTSTAEALLEVGGDAILPVEDVRDPHLFSEAVDELVASQKVRESLAENGLMRAAGYTWNRTAKSTVSMW